MPEEVSFYNPGEGWGGFGEPGDDVPQDYVLGRLSWVEDETGLLFATYDRLGQQIAEAQQIKETYLDEVAVSVGSVEFFLSRTYHDDLGRVIAEIYPDDNRLTVITEYDNRGNISLIRGHVTNPDPSDPDPNPDPEDPGITKA